MNEVRWVYFPYCIRQLADGRFIPLNRRYKPLGVSSGDWVEYETHYSAAAFQITESTAAKLSYSGDQTLTTIYFYNDSTNPQLSAENMRAYLARLELFMNLKIKPKA